MLKTLCIGALALFTPTVAVNVALQGDHVGVAPPGGGGGMQIFVRENS